MKHARYGAAFLCHEGPEPDRQIRIPIKQDTEVSVEEAEVVNFLEDNVEIDPVVLD